ncbi:MAG: hypothetical protein HY924_09380 [Elusimicrobia bacterium]|nr:hypothetical protein [Elusimicrobiota bacterium]
MPILEVEIVLDHNEALLPGLSQRLADAAGKALGVPPGYAWVRLRALPRKQYAESGSPVPKKIKPVFVSLMKSRLGSTAELRKECAKLCRALAKACGRPKENVHIIYLPEAAGRMSFGGKLMP